MASLTAGGLVLLAGCGQILGADDYSIGAQNGRDAGASAGTLFDPKPPYLIGPACEACVAASCAREDAKCSDDADCAAWLADARAKPDPVSAFAQWRKINTARWNAEHAHDGGVVTVPQIDLRICARNHCTSECELGRDFSCFGNFEWPRTFPTETQIRLRLVNSLDLNEGLTNFGVRACLDAGCAEPLGHAMTDAEGFVELAIRPRKSFSQYPEFNGVLLFDGGPLTDGGLEFYPLVAQSSRPWVSGDYGVMGHIRKEPVEFSLRESGRSYDPTMAYYGVQPWDCRFEPVKGVTVEIQVFDETALKPCDTCTVVYSDDNNVPVPGLTDFSSLGQIAYIIGPARRSVVVLRDTKTRRAVAAISLVTLPGHWHNVFPYPPSSVQLAEFPGGAL